jgi:hypothetical protein
MSSCWMSVLHDRASCAACSAPLSPSRVLVASPCNSDNASSPSVVPPEADFSTAGCDVGRTLADDVSPFSNGFLLSEDVTVGATSPLTTAATSLVHLCGMNNSTTAAASASNSATNTHDTTTTKGGWDSCTASVSVLHAASAESTTDVWPTRATTTVDVDETSLSTPNLSDDASAPVVTAAETGELCVAHTGGGHEVPSSCCCPCSPSTSTLSFQQQQKILSAPLRLHWCCAAHWRAVRRMERGVQAPVGMLADAAVDVYCIPAHVKRQRRDVHLAADGKAVVASFPILTLPSSIAVAALPQLASLPCCEYCGATLDAVDEEEQDEDAPRAVPQSRGHGSPRFGKSRLSARTTAPAPQRRPVARHALARHGSARGGSASMTAAMRKQQHQPFTLVAGRIKLLNPASVSNNASLPSTNALAGLDRVESMPAVAAGMARASSFRDAAMLAALEMF